jgi:hypothetical protein
VRSHRDLVLAMSVAEIFLLLLFVVWIASQAQAGPLDIEQLKKQVAKLQKESEEHQSQIQNLLAWKSAYEAFIVSLGQPVPKSIEDVLQRTKQNATRGGNDFPPCSEKTNRVMAVRVANGAVQLRVLGSVSALPFADGQIIEGNDVDVAVKAVTAYQNANSCRFSYRFEFGSDADYRSGRQRFDRIFYPGGEAQVSEPAR